MRENSEVVIKFTPVISGLTLLIPFITGFITHLLSGMSHQVGMCVKKNPPVIKGGNGQLAMEISRDKSSINGRFSNARLMTLVFFLKKKSIQHHHALVESG